MKRIKVGAALSRLFRLNTIDGTAVLESNLDEETVEIPALQIFAAGDYGDKGKYGDAELDEMIATFRSDGKDAPVTLDHAPHGPAYGVISKVWREGSKLMASLSDVPKSLVSAIKAKRYSARSVELFRDVAGKLRLARVSFLGAARPEVGGMDAVALSESGKFAEAPDGADVQSIEWAFSESRDGESFGEYEMEWENPPIPETDPNPEGHGDIVRQMWSSESLGHTHLAYLDENGNGFTSAAWRDGEKAGDHFHLVQGGKIASTPVDGNNLTHTHGLTLFSFDSRETGRSAEPSTAALSTSHQDSLTMTDTSTVAPEKGAAPAERFDSSALEAEIASLKAKFSEQENARAVERRSAQMERFEAAKSAVISGGQMPPALADDAKAFYEGLIDGTNAIKFGEAAPALDAPAAFLAFMRKLPKFLPFGETAPGAPASVLSDSDSSADLTGAKLDAKARAYMSEKNVDYKTALIAVAAE